MVTGFSYYPSWRKLPQDHGKLFHREIYKGVQVLRGYFYVPKKVSTPKRILHELSFCLFAALNFVRAGRQDCIIIISPPLLLGLVGVAFKWLFRSRLVFHIQDLQPDAALSLGMVKHGLMIRFLSRIEKFIYTHSDHVATITEAMRSRLLDKGVPSEKLGLYYNWIDVARASKSRPAGGFRSRHPEIMGNWIVAYAGNIGVKQGADVLVKLAEAMRTIDAIHFVIAGDGADKERLKTIAARHKLSNLTFLPFLSQADYFDLLRDIQVSFIAQRRGAGNVFFPSKLLGIMAMSKPVLISADRESELSSFVRRHNCGLTADAEDIPQLAASIESLYADPVLLNKLGANARHAVEQFDRDVILERFFQRIQSGTEHEDASCVSALTGPQ